MGGPRVRAPGTRGGPRQCPRLQRLWWSRLIPVGPCSFTQAPVWRGGHGGHRSWGLTQGP